MHGDLILYVRLDTIHGDLILTYDLILYIEA